MKSRKNITHCVQFSGGIQCFEAARRVRTKYPNDRIVALFADTKIEDEDLYRFLPEAAAFVGAELVHIADGRTPWQVFRDERFLGNSRIDPCSKILKRQILDRWTRDNLSPNDPIYVGIDWPEIHRLDRLRVRLAPRRVEAPLTEPPYLTKRDMLARCRAIGIEPPRLYGMGFVHNNCGGGCVKAGKASFANLLRTMPKRYDEWEQNEQVLRDQLGDVSILTDRSGDTKIPLTLRAFRERVQAGASYDLFDIGGCGCAIE